MQNNETISAGLSVYKTPFVIGVITALSLCLFAAKPFHIDDPLFIWAGKHIQQQPADFYGFTVNWYGYDKPMYNVMQNPPLACYYIALVGALFGYSEIALHTAFILPAALAAIGFYYLARKLCPRPALAALAAILTPGFLVSGTSIMCDIMMLAFWVWAVYFWIRGLDENKSIMILMAVLLAALSGLTKYFGVVLIPLLFAYAIVKKRRLGRWVLFLLIPILILVAYQCYTIFLYGHGLLGDTMSYVKFVHRDGINLLTKSVTGLVFMGGCGLAILFYIPYLSKRLILFCAAAAALSGVLVYFNHSFGIDVQDVFVARLSFAVQAGLMLAGGCCVLGLMFADLLKNRNAESVLLALWVCGTFVFAALVNWTVNARSVLPLIPAASILLFRQIENNKSRRFLTLPLIPAAIIAMLVCAGDYVAATTPYTAAVEICKKFQNEKIWFQGHWGFQYYMEQFGASALNLKKVCPNIGDLIISPLNNTNVQELPQQAVDLRGGFQFQRRFFITTMDELLAAGFYTDVYGNLPFAVGAVSSEKYVVHIAIK